MQSDSKILYQLTTERTGKSEQFYKDLGTFVFKEIYSQLRRPKNLIIKVRGIGTWYLRKKRMEKTVYAFPPDFTKEEFETDLDRINHETRIEVHNLFIDRLKEYEDYLKIRNEIRAKRYETQKLLEPPKEEN